MKKFLAKIYSVEDSIMEEYLSHWKEDASKLVATDEKGKIIFWDRNLNQLTELQY